MRYFLLNFDLSPVRRFPPFFIINLIYLLYTVRCERTSPGVALNKRSIIWFWVTPRAGYFHEVRSKLQGIKLSVGLRLLYKRVDLF